MDHAKTQAAQQPITTNHTIPSTASELGISHPPAINPSQPSPFDSVKLEPPHSSSFSVITWLLIFPPIGFYKMYKEEYFYKWIPSLIWSTALLGILSELSLGIPIGSESQIPSNYQKLLDTASSPYSSILSYCGLIFSILLLFWGFYLRKKIKEKDPETKKLIGITFLVTIGVLGIITSIQAYFDFKSYASLFNKIQNANSLPSGLQGF